MSVRRYLSGARRSVTGRSDQSDGKRRVKRKRRSAVAPLIEAFSPEKAGPTVRTPRTKLQSSDLDQVEFPSSSSVGHSADREGVRSVGEVRPHRKRGLAGYVRSRHRPLPLKLAAFVVLFPFWATSELKQSSLSTKGRQGATALVWVLVAVFVFLVFLRDSNQAASPPVTRNAPAGTELSPETQNPALQAVVPHLVGTASVTVRDLDTKTNTAGEGSFVYAETFGAQGTMRFVWLVLGDDAYPLTATAREATPSLPDPGAVADWQALSGLDPNNEDETIRVVFGA